MSLILNSKDFDEASIAAAYFQEPAIYTIKSLDLQEDDLRLAGKKVCIWPDGQLDIIGEA